MGSEREKERERERERGGEGGGREREMAWLPSVSAMLLIALKAPLTLTPRLHLDRSLHVGA